MSQYAVVIGSSGGIGSAFASVLENAGQFSRVFRMSRTGNADSQIDIIDDTSVRSAAASVATAQQSPTLIFVATGLLHDERHRPEKSIREIDPAWMALSYNVNAIGPALIAKHFMPLMPKKGRTVLAFLSARVGSVSDNRLGGWYSYRAAKSALNMIVRNAAIESSRINPESIVIALHPGTVETALSQPFSGGGQDGGRFTPQTAAEKLYAVIGALTPNDSGNIFGYDGNRIDP
jgi:NAD(P)-dependent dehydrogenase (short-subunit alcohol dehydrogenase family)